MEWSKLHRTSLSLGFKNILPRKDAKKSKEIIRQIKTNKTQLKAPKGATIESHEVAATKKTMEVNISRRMQLMTDLQVRARVAVTTATIRTIGVASVEVVAVATKLQLPIETEWRLSTSQSSLLLIKMILRKCQLLILRRGTMMMLPRHLPLPNPKHLLTWRQLTWSSCCSILRPRLEAIFQRLLWQQPCAYSSRPR